MAVTDWMTLSNVRIPRAPGDAALELSFAEEVQWIQARMRPLHRAFNIHLAGWLNGPLNRTALGKSLTDIVSRHEMLRTGFGVKGGRPVRRVGDVDITIQGRDLHEVASTHREESVRQAVSEAVAAPFDIERPMIRAHLIKVAAEEHLLVLTMHHIIADAWSVGVIANELEILYGRYSEGRAGVLPPLPIRYADYAAWQRALYTPGRVEDLGSYWRERLVGVNPRIKVPTLRPPSEGVSALSAHTGFTIRESLVDEIRSTSRRHRVTVFTLLAATYALLLYRVAEEPDIVFCVPLLQRSYQELAPLVGLFVDLVPLRIDCSGNPTFAELLSRTWRARSDLRPDRALPLLLLRQVLGNRMANSWRASFQLMLNFIESQPAELRLPGLRSRHWQELDTPPMTSEIYLSLQKRSTEIEGSLTYKADLFSARQMQEFARRFQSLLASTVAEPTQRLDEYSLEAP